MQPHCQLLPHLTQITPQSFRFGPVARRLKGLIQWKARLAWYAELLEGTVDKRFLCRPGVRIGFDLSEAVGDEENAIYQHAVGGTFDFEVAEEGVGAEEGEDLV